MYHKAPKSTKTQIKMSWSLFNKLIKQDKFWWSQTELSIHFCYTLNLHSQNETVGKFNLNPNQLMCITKSNLVLFCTQINGLMAHRNTFWPTTIQNPLGYTIDCNRQIVQQKDDSYYLLTLCSATTCFNNNSSRFCTDVQATKSR